VVDSDSSHIEISNSAVVSDNAEIGRGTVIGHGTAIGDRVRIGRNVRIGAYNIIEGRTSIDDNCIIYHHTVLGTPPQDLKYRGEDTELWIGNGTTIREFANINLGTENGHGKTVVGNNCFLMGYIHVAHDCILGNNVIMANAATLAGHIEVHDHAIIGGLSAVHQFTRIGKYALVGGMSGISQDVLPYSKVAGNHAKTYSINTIGLQRAGFSKELILDLKKVFRIFYSSRLRRQEAIKQITTEFGHVPEVKYFLDFVESSQRGICKGA
jgi:UDP-N-acetylglucosamine acyltransferase